MSLTGYSYSYSSDQVGDYVALSRDPLPTIQGKVVGGSTGNLIAALWPKHLPLWRYVKWAWSQGVLSLRNDFRKTETIETLLRVWDGYQFDNGDVMRDSVAALLSAAYDGARIEVLSPSECPTGLTARGTLAEQGRAMLADADKAIAESNVKPEEAYKAVSAVIDRYPPGSFHQEVERTPDAPRIDYQRMDVDALRIDEIK